MFFAADLEPAPHCDLSRRVQPAFVCFVNGCCAQKSATYRWEPCSLSKRSAVPSPFFLSLAGTSVPAGRYTCQTVGAANGSGPPNFPGTWALVLTT